MKYLQQVGLSTKSFYSNSISLIHPEYCEVYEQFTSHILFKMDTGFFMELLKKWRNFCLDFRNRQWVCAPHEQVKPEYLAELEVKS